MNEQIANYINSKYPSVDLSIIKTIIDRNSRKSNKIGNITLDLADFIGISSEPNEMLTSLNNVVAEAFGITVVSPIPMFESFENQSDMSVVIRRIIDKIGISKSDKCCDCHAVNTDWFEHLPAKSFGFADGNIWDTSNFLYRGPLVEGVGNVDVVVGTIPAPKTQHYLDVGISMMTPMTGKLAMIIETLDFEVDKDYIVESYEGFDVIFINC